ncbi:MAG: aldo/keto reductase [Pseudomonadota bacterium]
MNAPQVERRLGAATVGALGFGGAPLGNLYAPIPEAEALAAVARAHALGLRYFDTAPHYGHGLSEHRLGHVLRNLPRDGFTLSTKVGRLLAPDQGVARESHGFVGTLPFRQHFDYSYDGALRSIEDSLQRLGLGRIDIVYIHDVDRYTHGAEAYPRQFAAAMAGAYRALERLRRAGAIRAIGLGVNEWEVCRDALAHGDFDGFLLAGRYTLLDQSALRELLPAAAARGVGIVIGGPYNSGILATGAVAGARYFYRPAAPEILARVAAIEAVCRRFGVPLRAAALRFPLAHQAVVSVIPGARSAAEVEANVALLATAIPPEFWPALKSAGLLPEEAPVPAGVAAP